MRPRFVIPLRKALGPYIGPNGGKWADPEHTVSWRESSTAPKHYAFDKTKWQREARDRNAAEDKTGDTYVRHSLKLVPLEQIEQREPWSDAKLAQVAEGIKQGKELPPIRAYRDDSGHYLIDDGIHRVHASRAAGLSHVPVFTSDLVSQKPVKKALLAEAVLEAIPEAVGEALFKAQGHKYVRRVPYTDSHGKQRYRYFYRESAAARGAVEGEHVSLGGELAKVLAVGADGTVTLELDGEERRIKPNDWHNLLASHYGGDRYFAAAERRASQAVNAVLRHVPAELLSELSGTDAERLEQLRTRVPVVYANLQQAFRRAGIDAPQAKRVLGAVLERRGWKPNARAAAIGHVLEHRDLNVRTLIRGAENLAGGKPVTAGHVKAMGELRHPTSGKAFADDVAETAQRAEAELAKLSALLSQGKGPQALAQALSSPAMTKLMQLAKAMPGLKDEAIEPVRETLLQVPAHAPRGEPTVHGAETTVYVAGENGNAQALSGQYRLVEADDAIASHKPGSFRKREQYPEGVQERAYHRDEAEQAKVVRNAHKLNPSFVVNTNPDAVNGPPVMDQHGVVLGGNSRTMSMQYAYEAHPERAAEYKRYLAEQAHTVGLKASDVEAMRNPILVRVVQSDGTDHQKLLVRQMNESFTQGMDPRTMQVAMGRKLDDAALRVLGDTMDPDETLSAFLDTKRSEPFVNSLMRAGVIDQRNMNQYMVKGTRTLNEDGKQLVSRILVGRTLNDADLLSDTQSRLIDNIARAVPYLAQAKTHGAGYDLGEDLKTAVSAYNDLRKQGKNLSADITDAQFSKLFNQQHMFEEAHPIQSNPRAMGLLEVLIRKNGPTKMAELFKDYAARAQHHPEGQSSMFGDAPSPAEIFHQTLKASLAKSTRFVVPLERARVMDFYLQRAALQKGRTHKYLARHPDGKGGWRYVYAADLTPGRADKLVHDAPEHVRDEVHAATQKVLKLSPDPKSLEFVGAGGEGLVFKDSKRAYKVGRSKGLEREAAALAALSADERTAHLVPKFHAYRDGVLVRDHVEGHAGTWGGRGLREAYDKITEVLGAHNYTPPEFKENSFIVSPDGAIKMVDLGFVQEKGARNARGVLRRIRIAEKPSEPHKASSALFDLQLDLFHASDEGHVTGDQLKASVISLRHVFGDKLVEAQDIPRRLASHLARHAERHAEERARKAALDKSARPRFVVNYYKATVPRPK